MSVLSINQTLSGLGLSGLSIMYDFSSFNAAGDVVESSSIANESYSGKIINADAQFTGQNSGSGYFRNQYIEIQNTENITSQGCTMFFSQEKTGNQPGVLFSNLDSPSGFEVGITAANKFYYKNIIDGYSNYTTLENYSADKNLYVFTRTDNGFASLKKLDFVLEPRTQTFLNARNVVDGEDPNEPTYYGFNETQSFVPSYTVSNGSSWKIGTGEFGYKGYIDYFLYFDSELSDDPIRKIARSIHVETQYVPPATGLVSGIVTGYNVTSFDISGLANSTISVSGSGINSGYYSFNSGVPLTGSVGISGEVFVPKKKIGEITGSNLMPQTIYKRITNLSFTHTLTGGAEIGALSGYYSSGSYWLFSGNSGNFNGSGMSGPAGNIVGITGFQVVQRTGYLAGNNFPVITGLSSSGTIGSGFNYSEIREPDFTYTGTGGYFTSGPDIDQSYYPSALSVIGPPDPSYIYDILYDISGGADIQNTAVNSTNNKYNIVNAFMTGTGSPDKTNLYINGVSSFTGSVIFGTNSVNFPIATSISGFTNEIAELFTLDNLSLSDDVTYDSVPSREKEHLTINSLSDYAASPFTEITETENDIFFNGVKLLEGEDYLFAGGFKPIGTPLQSTGVYFTNPSYTGEPALQRATGVLLEPFSVYHKNITPNGYVLYYNGIRQNKNLIIEHGRYSDLITGVDKNIVSNIIYTMDNGEDTNIGIT